MFDIIKKYLFQKKSLPKLIVKDIALMVYNKNNLIDSDVNMYLTVETLIQINNNKWLK